MSKDAPPGNDELAKLVAGAPHESESDSGPAVRELVKSVVGRVGGRWFAVRAASVREVVTRPFVTKIPTAPPHVEGLVMVHGRLVPVIALDQLVSVPQSQQSAVTLPRLIIVENQDSSAEIALTADEAHGVLEIELPDTTSVAPTNRSAFVIGDAEWQGRMVAVLDADKLVAAIVHGEVGP